MHRRWLVLASVFALGLVVFVLVSKRTAGGDPAWGCPPERIGAGVADSAPTGGSATALDAAAAFAPYLSNDSGIPEQRYESAFASSDGPTSYDSKTGNLLIDGELQAQIHVGQPEDGTWVVSSLDHCMRPPPSDDKPGETPSDGAVNGPLINWKAPLSNGITVQDSVEAAGLVSFKVVDPGLGGATLIQVDDPKIIDEASLTVAFVYDLANDGIVNVEEQKAADGAEADLVARADAYAAAPNPDASAASFEMVRLGDGQALLVSGGGRGAELWVQNGVLFEITGETLTPDQAQELAGKVYPAAVAT